MERSAGTWMLAAALRLACIGPAPCAAQTPGPPPPPARPERPQEGGPPPSAVADAPWPEPEGRRREVGGPARSPPPRSRAAPIEPTDLRFPINLATALRLSDARPLIVAAAQASVWVAEAELTRPRSSGSPTLNIGFDYIRHDGGGPDFNKGILTAASTNFFYAGAGLWGSQMGIIPTTDAIFSPWWPGRSSTPATGTSRRPRTTP